MDIEIIHIPCCMQILLEVLRLYPPAFVVTKEAMKGGN